MKKGFAVLLVLSLLLTFTGCSVTFTVGGGESSSQASSEPTPAAPAPTEEPTPEPVSEPVQNPNAAPHTEEELKAVIREATDIFSLWFYDRNDVIDPQYQDNILCPVYENGIRVVYPVNPAYATDWDDLYNQVHAYFSADLTEKLLEEAGAKTNANTGKLCVTKPDGLGGVDLVGEVEVEWKGSYYEVELKASPADDPSFTMVNALKYSQETDGKWVFEGRITDVNNVFSGLLYMADTEWDFDLD